MENLGFRCGLTLQDEVQAPGPRVAFQAQSSLSREELSQKPSARVVQPNPGFISTGTTGTTGLLQDCLQKSFKSAPTIQQLSPAPSRRACPGSGHHTSLSALHHPCQSSTQIYEAEQHLRSHLAHYFNQHAAPPSRPTSGHHSCPLLPQHRHSCGSVKPDSSVKLPSRSSSYEKSSVFSKSASSSKAASPMASPHLSPCPSPCPSLVIPAGPRCGPDRPCSPALPHRVMVADVNRLSADCRPQQRGMKLSNSSGCSLDSRRTWRTKVKGAPSSSPEEQNVLKHTQPLIERFCFEETSPGSCFPTVVSLVELPEAPSLLMVGVFVLSVQACSPPWWLHEDANAAAEGKDLNI